MEYKSIVIWCLLQLSIFILGFFLQKQNEGLALLNQLKFSVYTSRGAGLCLAITPAMMLFPMCRHTVTLLRDNIPYTKKILPDFSIAFHKLCAYTILFWTMFHVVGHYFNFYGVQNTLQIDTVVNLHYTIFAGLTGHLMLVSMFFIYIFSGIYFRIFKYNLFWYSHHLFIVMFTVYPMHGIGCFVKTDDDECVPYYSGVITAPVLLIYLVERIVREFRPYKRVIDVVYSSNNVFNIKIDSKISYRPGQYVLLKVPDISMFQWHAFTISSAPGDPYLEVAIKSIGDWTEALQKTLRSDKLLVQVDGAFGSPVDTVYDYDSVILVAAGIGITPYISIMKDIMNRYDSGTLRLKHIDVIWINRDIESFEWFNKNLSEIEERLPISILNFHMYLTDTLDDDKINLITMENLYHLNYVYKTKIPIYYGRPRFGKFFFDYSKRYVDTKTGCFVCGPKTIERAVRNMSKKHSNKNVKFEFNVEKFS